MGEYGIIPAHQTGPTELLTLDLVHTVQGNLCQIKIVAVNAMVGQLISYLLMQ